MTLYIKKILFVFVFMSGMVNCTTTQIAITEDQESSQSSHSLNSIHVVFIDALTGSRAGFGLSTRKGVDLAISEVNASGGVGNKKIHLTVADDQGEPKEAKLALENAVRENNVSAIIGSSASSRSIVMAPIAQKHQIPMISPTSTHPKVTEIGDYIFRVCFIDTFQGPVMARFIRNSLNLRKVAILRDLGSDYSLGLSEFFKKKFVELGGQVVSDEPYRAGDFDFKSQLVKIQSLKPELIYVPGYYVDVANIAKQARELNIKVPFAGGDGWDSSELYELSDTALDHSYFSSHFSSENKDPKYLKFLSAYRTQYHTIPNASAALGYDAAMVLFGAMKRVQGDMNTMSIRDELAKTQNHQGVTGKISLDKNRNAVKSAVILKIVRRKSHYVETVDPS